MADIAKYQIISAGGVELNGTIVIKSVGLEKQAIASFKDTTPNGVTVDINYTGLSSFSASPEILAEEAMIEVNDELEDTYGLQGNLTYKLIEPEPEIEPEILPNNGEEEVPVYIFRSSVPTNGPRGQINFEFKENEISCIGEVYRDSYDTDEYSLSLVEISSTEIDYPKLGDKVLQELNNQISEIDAVEELGTLEIVKTESEEASNFIHYTTIGKVVSTKPVSPLSEVLIEDDVESVGLKGNLTYSNENGEFKLKGEYKIDSTFKITLSLEGYQPKTINPFTLKFTPSIPQTTPVQILKSDQGNIELTPKQVDKQVVIESSGFEKEQVKIVSKSIKAKDPFGAIQAESINKLVKSVSVLLIPFILKMLAEKFGITDPKSALEKGLEKVNFSCPANLDELNNLIDLKNKATKQLNNLYNGLEKIKVAVEVADGIITAASIVANVLSVLVTAFPSIPFAPDPTKSITTKIPTPKGLKSTLEVIADTLSKLKIVSSAILLILTILIDKLKFVIDLLALMDGVIEECYARDGEGSLNNQLAINSLLLNSTQEQSVQTSPIVTNVKGFEMSVISVSGGSDQLQRRQAIAKNADGVIMLRGEPSFSANDQILIDELIFYINMNNLKSGASNETIINP